MSKSTATSLIFLFSAAASACGASNATSDSDTLYSDARVPGIVSPANPAEEKILQEIESLQTGESTTIDGVSITVQSSYHAASGRECRSISITANSASEENSSIRLVCKISDSWVYAPVVSPEPNRSDPR